MGRGERCLRTFRVGREAPQDAFCDTQEQKARGAVRERAVFCEPEAKQKPTILGQGP